MAAVGVVKTVDQIDDSAFAGAGFADQSDHFTRFNIKGKSLDNFFALFVAKSDVLKNDVSGNWFSFNGGSFDFFFR